MTSTKRTLANIVGRRLETNAEKADPFATLTMNPFRTSFDEQAIAVKNMAEYRQ